MIYLGRSSFYDEDTNEHYFIYKIGFTEDNNSSKRLRTYTSHNPSFKFLYVINGGTRKQEEALHQKFRHFRQCGSEWYKESQEILDFFKTATFWKLEELQINSKINDVDQLLRECRNKEARPKVDWWIITEFFVGYEYLKKDIKKYLADIFKKTRYESSPNISFLREYYKIEPVKIKDKEGVYREGYRIISVLDEYKDLYNDHRFYPV